MTRRSPVGTVYLIHSDRPYRHARHYTGWASDLDARLAEHGAGRVARLLAVAKAAGITWTLARTWPGTRARERQLKNQGGASRHCPACKKESTAMTTSDPAARLGFTDASRVISAAYAGGADLDAIAAHNDDLSANLVSDAQTGPGRAYAREYADTGRTLISDLRQDAAVARGQLAPASSQPDRTPHPDPVLAARGWQVDHGIYQRTGKATSERLADREAG